MDNPDYLRKIDKINLLREFKNLGFPLASCAENCIAFFDNEGIAHDINYFFHELRRSYNSVVTHEDFDAVINAIPGIDSFSVTNYPSFGTKRGAVKVDHQRYAIITVNNNNQLIEVHDIVYL
jgi:hypothetical protein